MNIDFKTLVAGLRPALALPLVPESEMQGLRCEDHMTWVVAPEDKEIFIRFWEEYLDCELIHDTWITEKYPAEHIALKPVDVVNLVGCEGMIGLSVPLIDDSPLHETLNRYGKSTVFLIDDKEAHVPGVPQHLAYSVDPSLTMDEARTKIESLGYRFFTPVIEYKDELGSVEQCFFGCEKPFGTFSELVRRTGHAKQAFATGSIDFLYTYYEKESKREEEGFVS